MGDVYLTDLADACRSSGLRVIEEPGWEDRGHGGLLTRPQGLLVHHTAARASAYATNPYPSLRTVRDGRSDLAGPLSQIGLQRDLAVRVIAAGRCWHAGVVDQWWQDNDHAIGVEAEHDGVSLWPDDLYDAYVVLARALRAWYRLPLARVVGHKEAAVPKGRKTDPNFAMPLFRAAIVAGETEQEDYMATAEGKAQLDRIERMLAQQFVLEGKRWAQTQDTLVAHDKQEDGRYAELHQVHQKMDALLQELVDDPASPVTAADLKVAGA